MFQSKKIEGVINNRMTVSGNNISLNQQVISMVSWCHNSYMTSIFKN